jgi:membrane carboxypeptidase/penicillin-binding protein
MAHYVVKIARRAGIVALFVIAAGLGILTGVLFAYAGDLPQVSALDDYTPSTITRVYAANGQVVGEFATQRRVVVGYDDINPVLRQAIIATEDAEFDRHFGINIWRIFAAAATDILERRRAQGASTLTQQLARNLKEQFGLTRRSRSSARSRRSSSRSRSRSGTRRKRSSRSTATRCIWATVRTASRPRRGSTSTNRTSN